MKTMTAATMSATKANAAGQENRPQVADFDIGRWTLSVERLLRFSPKKIPPPTPEGREGRLFPPEQSSKTAQQVNELCGPGNKILTRTRRRVTTFA